MTKIENEALAARRSRRQPKLWGKRYSSQPKTTQELITPFAPFTNQGERSKLAVLLTKTGESQGIKLNGYEFF